MTPPSLSSIQAQLSKKQYANALSDALTLLETEPNQPDLLYMAAVCSRYAKQFTEAQALLEKLQGRFGDQARLLQEQGHLFRDNGNPQAAFDCYRSACQLNPYLLSSWQAQHTLAKTLNKEALLPFLQAQIQQLSKLPKALLSAGDLINQGKLLKAEALCRKFLKVNPTNPNGMQLLADLATRFGSYEDAELLLSSAMEIAPDNHQLHIDLINVLRRRQKFNEALSAANELYHKQPDNPQFQSLLAVEKMQLGNYDEAVELFDKILTTQAHDPITLTSKGHALKTMGEQGESINCYRQASLLGHGEAYYSLANLKTYSFSEEEVQAMDKLLLQKHLNNSDRIHIEFALGKAHEDREDFKLSFAHYKKGNAAKKSTSNYNAEDMGEELSAQAHYFSSELFKQRLNQGCDKPDPIFIVGLPRAGSTLLEQILSSHSLVDGTLELPNILTYVSELRKQAKQQGLDNYLDILNNNSAAELAELGQRYLDETQIHRINAPFFIDKMPNNFRHIGLIKLILPNAKIIDARRHPMACCFSGFKQLFAEGQEFSYHLNDIAQYYKDYTQLMSHWDHVIPGQVLKVNYESVVANIEAEVHRLLDYCQLPFEAQCIEFYKTQRAVRTASSEQVRQPIYQQGLDQWVNYEAELEELKQSLKSDIEAYP